MPTAPTPNPSHRMLALATLLIPVASLACDAYEPPCSADPPAWVLDEPAPTNTLPSALSLAPGDRDTVVASWLTTPTTEASRGALSRQTNADVAVISVDGTLLERYSLPVLQGWSDDDMPQDDFAFCFTPSGLILRWTRETTVSPIGEPPRTRKSLWVQRISLEGQPDPAFAPLNMSCVDCTVRLTSACLDNHATVLFSSWPNDPNDDTSDPASLRALSWSLVANQTTSGPVDWLGDPSSRSLAPGLVADQDSLLLFDETQAWAVDSEARLRGGPIPLPVPSNRVVRWSADTYESLVVWSAAAVGSDARHDVFLRRFDGFGRPTMPTERLGESSRVVSLAWGKGEVGVVFRDKGGDAFAWADENGTRIGGDVPLGTAPAGAVTLGGTSEWLHAFGNGRFVRITGLPRRMQRTEIRCVQ